MDRSQKTTFLILSLIGLLYFILFIFPNQTGARDATMLSVFQHDEFAQYPHVIRMLTTGDTPYQSLRNFLVYQHYYYGYPFYFFSALSILPVRLTLGSAWAEHTPVIVLVLRQAISVLPMIISALLLVWMQTGFRSRLRAIVLFLFMLTLPAVVTNNMWWHPDSLLVLFTVLTIFFLARDNFRFGKNFYFSAVSVGLAIGVKILGVLFALSYLVYLLYGLKKHSINLKQSILRSLFFLGVMIATIILSNPLLLLPIERAEIISVFMQNLHQNTVGFWVTGNTDISMFQQVADIFRYNYTSILILLVSMIGLVCGIIHTQTRTINLLILTWTIGYLGYFILFASTMRTHYLLPIALPLLSSIAILLPERISFRWRLEPGALNIVLKNFVPHVLIIGLLVQIVFNIGSDKGSIQDVATREETSPSIRLYKEAEREILSQIQIDRKLRIYRDWRAYVAEKNEYHIEYNWELATYDYINEIHPDVLFIERENMVYFSDAAKIDKAIDPHRMREMFEFYSDAINGALEGFTLVNSTSFGSVFVKTELFLQYLD